MSEYKDFLAQFKGKMNSQQSESTKENVPEEESVQKNIKATPLLQTSGNSQVHIPDTPEEEVITENNTRFIKTGETPFVSTSEKADTEQETTNVDKYTDRLSARSKEKKRFSRSGAASSYAENHSSDASTEKFIKTPENAETAEAEEDTSSAPEATEIDDKTKPLVISEDFGDILAETGEPTKYFDSEKGSLMREIALTANDDIRQNPDQLMMEGFDTAEQEEKARQEALEEEKRLEKELSEVRRKRVNSFQFWNKNGDSEETEVDDEKFSAAAEKTSLPMFLKPFADKLSAKFEHLDNDFTPVNSEEFKEFESRKKVFASLLETRHRALFKTVSVAVLGIVLLLINILTSASAAENAGFFTLFGGETAVYVAINFIVLLIVCVLLARELKNGLFSLLKVHPKADTSLLFMIASALLQTFASFFTQLKIEENYHFYSSAVILLCVPYLAGKLFYYDNIRHCFKAAGAKSEKSYLRRVSDEETVSTLLRDNESRNANVVYSGKTRFISNFIQRSAKSANGGMPSSRTVLICIAVSVLAGIIAWIAKGGFLYALSAMTLCAAFSFPVSCITATGFFISKENKALSLKTSFVHSYTDARDFAAVDDIVISADDIFDAEITNVLTAKGVNEMQAKFCAAVLTNSVSSPVSSAFKATVSGLEDRFPKVEDYTYEYKLGHSAWIQNCRVLLGSSAFLVNHNVKAPDENAAMHFLNENEKPLFLSLEGNFAAMFAVKYSCKADVRENLRSLVETGTNILISSNDPNITEEYTEHLLGLPANSVRIISPAAVEKLNGAKNAVTDSEDAGIVFTSSFDSLCRCAGAALRLDRTKKLCKLICEGGAFVGLALSLILVITGAFSSTASFMPVLLQIVWLIICFGAPFAFGNSSIRKGSKPVHTARQSEAQTDFSAIAENTAEEENKNDADDPAPISEAIEEKDSPLKGFLASIRKGTAALSSIKLPQKEKYSEETGEAQEDDNADISENDLSQIPTERKFSLFGDFAEKRQPKSEKQLQDEKRKLSEILHFTPPEMPEPPKFNFPEKEKEEKEDPLNMKFVPPEDKTPINVYDDALFSRYDDDNIFAGLKEESRKKFEF